MGFLDYLFRYPSFNIWILALFFTIDCFHLVESQETPVIIQSPPPPPPPPPPPSPPPPSPPPPLVNVTTETVRVAPQPSLVTDVTEPLSSPPLLPPPQKNLPRRLPPPPQPPPPQLPPTSRPRPPEKSKRDGLNKGEIVGVVFAGLIAMLQVFVAVFLVFKRKQLLNFKDTN